MSETTSDSPEEQQSLQDPIAMMRAHASLIASAGIFAFFILKLFIVARGNLTTFKVMLTHAGATEVIIGAIAVSTPYILTLGPVYLMDVSTRWTQQRRMTRQSAWITCISSILLGILILPLLFVAAITLLTAFFVQAGNLIHAGRKDDATYHRKIRSYFLLAAAVLVIGGVVFFILDDEPWLPAEQLTLDGGEHQSGWVLAEDEETLLVLSKTDRTVIRLNTRDVEVRRFCDFSLGLRDDWLNRPLLSTLFGRRSKDYPMCDA